MPMTACCVDNDPPGDSDQVGAVVSWWSLDAEVEKALGGFVPRSLAETWRFESGKLWP